MILAVDMLASLVAMISHDFQIMTGIPQGAWHRFEVPEAVGLMTATPKPTRHLTFAIDDLRSPNDGGAQGQLGVGYCSAR